MRLIHAVATVFWLIMLPITLVTGLKSSLPYLTAISVWALIASHASAWAASSADVAAREE